MFDRAQNSVSPPLRQDAAGQSRSGLHISAVIATASYALGAALAAHFDASMRQEMLNGGAGLYLQLLALAGFIIAVGLIQRHMGIPLSAARTETPPELCTSGPFMYSRNPIYLAFVVPLAALGYFSPLAAAISIAIYLLAMTWLVIRGEERILQSRFGSAFEVYCNRTPRWILLNKGGGF